MNDNVTISTFQLFKLFPDEESARKYLESRLWPKGVRCPHCGLIVVKSADEGRIVQRPSLSTYWKFKYEELKDLSTNEILTPRPTLSNCHFRID